ncbi:MAG: energy-coupling factor transporter transmembrane protein EcfT [Oscillospiraceae bacterium]|jgi:energy-coupling factor transport system permease protein|nr:energy-coupling factor transporter transmembrane protein EcfT [Oscillospiraceae bacterium]
MKNIAIGQYFPGNSVLHKIDPRVKILLTIFYTILIFVVDSYVGIAAIGLATFICITLSEVRLITYLGSLKIIGLIALITSLVNLLYGSDEKVLFSLYVIKITENSVKLSILVFFRIIFAVLASSQLMFTTMPNDLSHGIERLIMPLKFVKVPVHEIAMMMTISLRFVPILLEESDKIIMARKARGAKLEQGSLKNRIKAFLPVLMLLFVSSFRKTNDLATAMDCRCYRGGEGRTKMRVLKLKFLDLFCILVFSTFFVPLLIFCVY